MPATMPRLVQLVAPSSGAVSMDKLVADDPGQPPTGPQKTED